MFRFYRARSWVYGAYYVTLHIFCIFEMFHNKKKQLSQSYKYFPNKQLSMERQETKRARDDRGRGEQSLSGLGRAETFLSYSEMGKIIFLPWVKERIQPYKCEENRSNSLLIQKSDYFTERTYSKDIIKFKILTTTPLLVIVSLYVKLQIAQAK